MNGKDLELLKKQHYNNYRNSVKDIVLNNTTILVDEDMMSLFKKPPLDSMDVLKVKIIEISKRYKLLVNTEMLEKKLDCYRKSFSSLCENIKKNRIQHFYHIIDQSSTELIKINKKDFIPINKEIKKSIKNVIQESFEKNILEGISSLFKEDISEELSDKIIVDCRNHFKKYFKQLLENIDIKLMVKDTILINACKEQNDRYLFTLNNSRLLNDDIN